MTTVRTANTTELLDQQPPCNLDAEKNLIGAILMQPATIETVKEIVRPSSFHDHRNGRIFGHLIELHDDGRGKIDAVLLTNRLKEAAEFEACGGAAYLAELFEWHPVPAHAPEYARIVRDHAIRRDLIHAATETLLLHLARGFLM